jgi:hypothetical protein
MVNRNKPIVLLFFCLLLAFTRIPAQAAAKTYTGALDLQNPNGVFLLPLYLTTSSDITIQTYSYGGGITHNGNVISAGSFDPTITLFVGSGSNAVFPAINFFNDDGTCPPANPDPATLLCLDSILMLRHLPAGAYTAVLTVANNVPQAVALGSGVLGDGFTGGGNYDEPPISAYAFDVVTTTATPEPSTMTLFGLAASSLYIGKRVARRQR